MTQTDRIDNLEKCLEEEQMLRGEEVASNRRRISDLEDQVEDLIAQLNLISKWRNGQKKNSKLSVNSFVNGV